jgi:hypothetical protein
MNDQFLSTREFGAFLQRPADSIRSALWRDGAVAGVRPVKMGNGRLAWPAAAVLATATKVQR